MDTSIRKYWDMHILAQRSLEVKKFFKVQPVYQVYQATSLNQPRCLPWRKKKRFASSSGKPFFALPFNFNNDGSSKFLPKRMNGQHGYIIILGSAGLIIVQGHPKGLTDLLPALPRQAAQ